MLPSIVARDITFAYSPGRPIIQNFSAVFPAGQFTGISGPNGSGKSTLVKLISGRVVPQTGQVWVNGLDTGDQANILPIKQAVTAIYADAENQLITSSVYDEIAFALQVMGLPEFEIRTRVEAALERFSLSHLRSRHPFYLSVGEQFRVLIAAAVVRNPQFLILDEALSMLDSPTRQEILALLHKLCHADSIGILMLSHRLEDLQYATHFMALEDGKIRFYGLMPNADKGYHSIKNFSIAPSVLDQVLGCLDKDPRAVLDRFG